MALAYLRFDNETNANNCRDNVNTFVSFSSILTENVVTEAIGPDWVVEHLPGYDFSGDSVTEVMSVEWYDQQKEPKFLQWVDPLIKNSKPFHTIHLQMEVDHDFYKSQAFYDEDGRPTYVDYYEDSTKTNLIFKREFSFSDYDNPGDHTEGAPDELILNRTETVKYITNAGDESAITSVKSRDFNPVDHYIERANEAILSRSNILKLLARDVVNFFVLDDPVNNTALMGIAEMQALVASHSDEIDDFEKTGDTSVVASINADTTHTLLDIATPYTNDAPDVRAYIVARINRQTIAS